MWNEDRLRTTLAEVLQDYIPHIEPESDLDVQRREALRHHLDRAHTILANPDAAPARYIGQGSVSAAQARTEATKSRARTLFDVAELCEDPVSQGDLLQLIVGGVLPGLHVNLEDEAISRAFRGYAAPDGEDLEVYWVRKSHRPLQTAYMRI